MKTITLKKSYILIVAFIFLILISKGKIFADENSLQLIFSCYENNDLYKVLSAGSREYPRYDTPDEAVQKAPNGAGLLILADGYPDKTTNIASESFELAEKKNLRLYIEYPKNLPGIEAGKPREAVLERGVVTSDVFGNSLSTMRIIMVQDCHFVPVTAEKVHIVAARVAGFDSAVYGLPKQTYPLLFEHPNATILVSTTKLSNFITARYAPLDAWPEIWKLILSWLQPGKQIPDLQWTPSVHPMFSCNSKLPENAVLNAIKRGTDWYRNARLLIHPSWKDKADYYGHLYPSIGPMPAADLPSGDGKCGVMEGFASRINYDGSQRMSWWVRDDCNGETAMAFALRCLIDNDVTSKTIAGNLLDFIYVHSNLQQGPRGNVNGDSFGLLDWATTLGVDTYYGDDNARAILGSITASAALDTDRWDEFIIRAILANFRTTGPLGFRNSRIMDNELQKQGWQYFWNTPRIHYAPHFESWIWACYLWLYDKTGFKPLLDRTKTGIRKMMEAYPDDWRWTNGIQQERARMLLPLAWLLRLEDTPEHRAWIQRIADDLLSDQVPCGAIREELGEIGKGLYSSPRSNEAYGTNEASLLQNNGEPLSDLLYTSNFAFFSLHEAAAATKDVKLVQAADNLADFLIRIQASSEVHPELNGAWFRAFDFNRWEYWGSSADAGWGPWCTETGWTQGWIVSTLALHHLNKSLWELTASSRIARKFDMYKNLMLPNIN